MTDLNIFFRDAVRDLVFLLDRRYPKKPAIELVGNRYRLGSDERRLLYRGVFDSESSRARKGKLIDASAVLFLLIDGYNVIITLESYLRGKTVFRSLDGYIRDISGMYGNHSFTDFTRRSVDFLIRFLKAVPGSEGRGDSPRGGGPWRVNPHAIFLDAPVSRSGELAAYLRERCGREGLGVEVLVDKNPDAVIIERSRGAGKHAVASSDTVVLDRVARSVDIPAYILEKTLGKKVLELEDAMSDEERAL
jgi:hypothetical protein